MKEVTDRNSGRWIRVEVCEPVTITTKEHIGWTSSFTSYLIRIETNHWAFSSQRSEIRRRFSEFCWLRSKLQHHHPNKIAPPLPAKRFFHMTKFDPKIIQERCLGLEKFLQRVMRSYVFLSDAALHLMLQSDLTMEEMELKLHEEIKPKLNYSKRMFSIMDRKLSLLKNTEFSSSLTSDEGSLESSSDGGFADNASASDDNEDKIIVEIEPIQTHTVLNTKEFDFSKIEV